MKVFHVSFTGRHKQEPLPRLQRRKITLILLAEGIYDAEDMVKDRYTTITNLCLTNAEACGYHMFEVKGPIAQSVRAGDS